MTTLVKPFVAVEALATDAALPQRDALLSEADVAERLAARLGAVTSCTRTWTKYRVGESLRALYVVAADSERHRVAVRTFGRGASGAAFAEARRSAVPLGSLPGVLHEPDLHAVFWVFPNDRRLRGLELLRDDATPPRHLLGGRWARTRLVSYAPERAATAECRDEDGALVAYAKVYADDAGRRSATIHTRLHDALRVALGDARRERASCLRLPRVLGYDDARRLVLIEPLPGRRLEALGAAVRRDAIAGLGAALAALHTLPAPDGPAFARFAPAHVRQGARILGRARPDVADLAGRVAESLVRQVRDAGPDDACLHGDMGAQNWMADGDSVSVIDLDQAARGPAGADIGGVLANLRTWPLTGRLTPDEAATLADDFLAGYGAVRPLPSPRSIRWHTAAALLVERGVRAVNRVRLDLLPWLPTILSDAHTLLG